MLNSPSIYFICISFMYSVFINILFYSRRHISTYETKIYGYMITLNLIGLLLEFSTIMSVYLLGVNSIIPYIVSKLFLVYLLLFMVMLTFYVLFVIAIDIKDNKFGKRENIIREILYSIFGIGSLLIFILPINIYYDGNIMYSYGCSTNVVYILSLISMIVCIISIIFSHRKEKGIKLIPLALFILGMGIVTVIQKLNPGLTLATTIETFVLIIMYNTIENPDIKLIKELETAKEEATKANRAKTDFLSSMSHEIRTPLNAIVGFSNCINDAKSLDEAKGLSRDIIDASNTLLEIVNGILDISKIEAGRMSITNSNYNAREVFTELATLITPKMREKGLDFTYKIASDLPLYLYGDFANMKKIVTNLLSNASKYTEKGFVRYEVNCINNNGICELIISVEDSGRGIKQENIDKLFTKFQRLDEDRNTTIEGTGLGLAITKQLVEMMGGKIIVHSKYGEGSKFTVVVNQRLGEAPLNTTKYQTTLDLKNVRILIVDDNLLNLKVAKKLLEKYNANIVVTTDSGFNCIDKIKNGEVYDLILLDDMMPKMSGVITLKHLKEIPGFNTPVVALTANAINGMREKYLQDGFDDYLAKPIDKNQLVQVINHVLGRSITSNVETINTSSPQVRDNIISVTDKDKDKVIKIDNNMEKELGSKLDIKKSDNIETLSDDILPVEDIKIDINNINSNSTCKSNNYDVKYLKDNGVDVNHGLELLGDMDMYNDTMHDFMDEVDEKWNNICKYKDSSDMPNYAIEVHSLKSDAKYLGFMKLADIAYQHELKSKAGDAEYVQSHFNELESEYKRIYEVASNYTKSLNI